MKDLQFWFAILLAAALPVLPILILARLGERYPVFKMLAWGILAVLFALSALMFSLHRIPVGKAT